MIVNRYFLIATLVLGFILLPLITKSVGCKLSGGTSVSTVNSATGIDEFVCKQAQK